MSSLKTPIYVVLGRPLGLSGFTSKHLTYAVLMPKPFLALSSLITPEENLNIFISAVSRTIFYHTAHLTLFYISSNLFSQICLTFFPQSPFLMTVDSNYKNATFCGMIPFNLTVPPDSLLYPIWHQTYQVNKVFLHIIHQFKISLWWHFEQTWGFSAADNGVCCEGLMDYIELCHFKILPMLHLKKVNLNPPRKTWDTLSPKKLMLWTKLRPCSSTCSAIQIHWPIAAHITSEISGLTQVCRSYCASINTDLAIDLDRFFSLFSSSLNGSSTQVSMSLWLEQKKHPSHT